MDKRKSGALSSYQVLLMRAVFPFIFYARDQVHRLIKDIRDLKIRRRRRQRNGNVIKANKFDNHGNNFARVSRFFVHFFAVTIRLRREITYRKIPKISPSMYNPSSPPKPVAQKTLR